jgi:site-specific recombinase XerD
MSLTLLVVSDSEPDDNYAAPGITKKVGWHTFRHTYSTLLSECGNDVKVVQELMRHAKLSTTMEIYTHARMEKKREAQSKVVDILFDRQAREVVAS